MPENVKLGHELADSQRPGSGNSSPQRPGSRKTSAPLVRVSVNLTAKATKALDDAVELTGDSQTDILNKAVQVYAHLQRILAANGAIYTQTPDQKEAVSWSFF